jgi:hypothetical protein
LGASDALQTAHAASVASTAAAQARAAVVAALPSLLVLWSSSGAAKAYTAIARQAFNAAAAAGAGVAAPAAV